MCTYTKLLAAHLFFLPGQADNPYLVATLKNCHATVSHPEFQVRIDVNCQRLCCCYNICELKLKAICILVEGSIKRPASTVSPNTGSCQKLQVLQESCCVAVSSLPTVRFSHNASKLWRSNAVACLSGRSTPAVPMRVVRSSPQPLLQHSEQLVTTE